jgi:polyferredoxin
LLFPANDRRLKGGRPDLIKYGLATLWLMAIAALFIRAGGLRVSPLFGIEGGVSLGSRTSYVMFFTAMGGMVALSLLAGRRPFCRYGCLLAPFMIAGKCTSRAVGSPRLRLAADGERCIHCMLCTKNCPMSIDVHAMVQGNAMESPECISCGACVDSCPKDVLSFAFSSGRKPSLPERRSSGEGQTMP